MMEVSQVIGALFRHVVPGGLALLAASYSVIFALSLCLGYALRFDFKISPDYLPLIPYNLAWIIPLKLLVLFFYGHFSGLLGFFRMPDLYRLLLALGTGSVLLVYIWFMTGGYYVPPRSVILSDFIISFLMISGVRIGLRTVRERRTFGQIRSTEKGKRVAIVGAGDAGAQVCADLLARKAIAIRPIAFLDDDRSKWRRHIHGIRVVDTPDNLGVVKQKFGLDGIVIAMPSASAGRIREIIDLAREHGLSAETVPSLAELTTGRVRANRVRPVDIADLLGRDPVELDSENIRDLIEDHSVLVTGAGGSIGAELCRQIATYGPSRLVALDRSEVQLFQTEQLLLEEGYGDLVIPQIGDVQDAPRMREVIREHGPATLFHAAAHKHVFLMERQAAEALRNNTLATARLADIASEERISRFVLISSDKAVNPTSVMGATKRLAEMYLQAKQGSHENTIRFMAVRFGNVLDSSGSVVPIFRRQIAGGGPVTVTHPDVTRYFMTVSEAVGLVLQGATQGTAGDILVLDMGEPVRIQELARQMIELSGFRPRVDIGIEFTGLKPGEKLFEELQQVGETLLPTTHRKILRFCADPPCYEMLQRDLDQLAARVANLKNEELKRALQHLVPEYCPDFHGDVPGTSG